MASHLSLKAFLGMNQVQSNEILSEEMMFNLPSRTVANESAASLPFGAFLLPEAITEAEFPV